MPIEHISELVGNTPLLRISPDIHNIPHLDLYSKLEYLNPGGSLKDRPARYFLKDKLAQVKQHKKIIEASSGNTIKALTLLGNTYGATTKLVTKRARVQEQLDLLQILGAEIEQLPPESDLTSAQAITQQCQQDKNWLHTTQYTNPENTLAHYETTAQEIYDEVGMLDYAIIGLGTTGISAGITQFFKEKNPNFRSIGVLSDGSDYIPGIRTRAEVETVGLFDESIYDEIITVNAQDALHATLQLIRSAGMLCGPTSGAAYTGLLDYFQEHPLQESETKQKCVFIACDRTETYLSYFKERIPELFGEKK